MRGSYFVDTNVLVYSRDSSEKKKQPLALAWLEFLWQERCGKLSTQVLNEYYVTVTRKLKPGLCPAEAREDVQDLFAWHPIQTSPKMIESAWSIGDRFQFSHWDSLIVAAAQIGGCDKLITEDLQDGQNIDGLHVLDPFTNPPGHDHQ